MIGFIKSLMFGNEIVDGYVLPKTPEMDLFGDYVSCQKVISDGINGTIIKYENEKERAFVALSGSQIGFYQGKPLYGHVLGNAFSPPMKNDMNMNDEMLAYFIDCHLGSDTLRGQRDLREKDNKINWLRVIVIACVVGVFIYLWQSGYLQQVINEILPSKG